MTLEELRAELAAGEPRPAYLLAGEEALLRDDALAALRERVLGSGPAEFNFERLDGESAAPGALLDAVRQLPVLAPHRLVVLREPDAGRGAERDLAQALAEVVAELQAGAGAGCVLVVSAARPDGRARWLKAFDPRAVVSCEAPKGIPALVAFARAEAERQGVRLEPGAAELLVDRVGAQLLLLRQEIAKAALLAGPGQPIARSHVEAGASDAAEDPIWELTDAIGEGRAADALATLARLLRAGAPPPVLLGSLASHFRRLLRLRSGGTVAGPPFVRRKLERQASRYTPARLLSCLRALHETDTALKGEGALGPELALERLVIGLSG
jgi:DNA polymerase-3 subunit delta